MFATRDKLNRGKGALTASRDQEIQKVNISSYNNEGAFAISITEQGNMNSHL